MSNQLERQALQDRMVTMPSGCIEWTGNINKNGYGRYCYKRKIELAHRAAWRLLRGDIPESMCVLHRCDNPPCVNPDHLFIGDRGINARDMASKGRQWIQQNPHRRADTLTCPIELKPRGEQHGMSKLNEAVVLAIRRRASRGELGKHLAFEFGCSTSLITEVIHGRIWQHVGGPVRNPKTKKVSHD